MSPDDIFLDRFGSYDIHDEPSDEAAQVKAMIESIGGRNHFRAQAGVFEADMARHAFAAIAEYQ